MSRLLICLLAFFSLSACTAFTFTDKSTYSTSHSSEAVMPMLALETLDEGYEMTSLYKPVIYKEAFQKSPYPATRRMTSNYIIKASRFKN